MGLVYDGKLLLEFKTKPASSMSLKIIIKKNNFWLLKPASKITFIFIVSCCVFYKITHVISRKLELTHESGFYFPSQHTKYVQKTWVGVRFYCDVCMLLFWIVYLLYVSRNVCVRWADIVYVMYDVSWLVSDCDVCYIYGV